MTRDHKSNSLLCQTQYYTQNIVQMENLLDLLSQLTSYFQCRFSLRIGWLYIFSVLISSFGITANFPFGPFHALPVKIYWWKMHSVWLKENIGHSSSCFLTLKLPPNRYMEGILVSNGLSGMSSIWSSTIVSNLVLYNDTLFQALKALPVDCSKKSFTENWYHLCIRLSRFRYRAIFSLHYLQFVGDSWESTKNILFQFSYLKPYLCSQSQTVEFEGVSEMW